MKTMIFALFLFGAQTSFAAPHEAKGPEAQAIDQQCQSDAATAGCANEKVGTGLLKCMFQYKKAHKDFKFSDGCKSAMKQFRQDHHKKK